MGYLTGTDHQNWKEKPSYKTMHEWVRKYKPKLAECEHCRKECKLELANKGHTYKRNIEDYLWLCRSCHRKMDGKGKPPKNFKIFQEKAWAANRKRPAWNKGLTKSDPRVAKYSKTLSITKKGTYPYQLREANLKRV